MVQYEIPIINLLIALCLSLLTLIVNLRLCISPPFLLLQCDADLPVTLHILGVVLPDTHLYEIEADHILLTTVGGDHTPPTLPVTAGEGHIPDLVPRTVGHLLADVNAPTLLMAQDTIHLTGITEEASLGVFHRE